MSFAESIKETLKFASEIVDSDRKQAFKESVEVFETEDEVHRRFDPGSFGSHEAADRTMLIMENVEHYLLKHPTIIMNEQAYHQAFAACQLLADVYQKVACADIPDEEVGPQI